MIWFFKDMKYIMKDCTIIGDKEYISKKVQLELFNIENIKLDVPVGKWRNLTETELSELNQLLENSSKTFD